MVDYEKLVSRASARVSGHPKRIVAAFLVITLVMSVGLGNITTSTGTSQFSEGTAAEDALQEIDQKFETHFG
ncbi:MAG: hypothetical protein ABEJ44_04290, partial [Halanaeroarchaeum sp.]